MTEGLILAAGLALGADRRLLALAAGVAYLPVAVLPALVVLIVAERRRRGQERVGREVRFAEAMLGELRAGASVRMALRTAVGVVGEAGPLARRLEAGLPLAEAMAGIEALLPTLGPLVVSAVSADGGGGRMVPVFEELLAHAVAEEEVRAELSAALAPTWASLTVLVGGPLCYLAWLAASGRFFTQLQAPGARAVAAMGAVLFAAGLAVVAWMMRGRR